MPSPDHNITPMRGSELMARLLEQARAEDGLAISDMLGAEGPVGLALALTALSAAALVPLPGPFGIFFGSCLMIVALQMLIGRKKLALPGFIARRRLSLTVVEAIFSASQPPIAFIEQYLSHGRLAFLTGHASHIGLAVLVFVLGLLIALPIPFGNALPAISVMLIALALANRDGLVVVLAVLLSGAASALSYFMVRLAGDLLAVF